jgi:hypothetical protein
MHYGLAVHQLEKFVTNANKLSRRSVLEKLATEEIIINRLSDPVRIEIAERRIEVLRSLI